MPISSSWFFPTTTPVAPVSKTILIGRLLMKASTLRRESPCSKYMVACSGRLDVELLETAELELLRTGEGELLRGAEVEPLRAAGLE